MLYSGLEHKVWKALNSSNEFSDEMHKYLGLKKCCEKNDFTFKDLKTVIEKEKTQTAHIICKVRLK